MRMPVQLHKTHANPFTPKVESLHISSPPAIFERSLQTDLRTTTSLLPTPSACLSAREAHNSNTKFHSGRGPHKTQTQT